MNLHITHDDKFLDFFIENEEKYTETNNRYIIYSYNKNLKYSKNKRIELVEANLNSLYNKIGSLQKYKTIYIHYLSDFLVDFINSLKQDVKIVWIFWGGDGFSQIKNYSNKVCLEKQTEKYYRNNKKDKMIWCKNPVFLYKNYKRFREKIINIKKKNGNYIRAIDRINFFAHYIYDDYILIKNSSRLNAKYIDFNYISTKQIVRNEIKKTKQINVIIGNSDTFTNNHLDVFEKMSHFNLSKIDNIYVPLSYGDDNLYRKTVIKYGKKVFGNKFKPMTDFIPLKEYNDILDSVSIALFGLIRSQAAGNILALLMSGSRVYMNTTNTLYKLFKQSGIIIFDINNDFQKHIEEDNIYFLSEKELKNNNVVLENLFGENKVKSKYISLLNID